MNKLKIARGKRTQKQVASYLKTVDARVDDKLISKYELGICLPTKTQLNALCLLYGFIPAQLYKRGELALANALDRDQKHAIRQEPDTYSFTVKLPPEFRGKLTDDKFKEWGYQSRADWIIKTFEIFNKIKEPASTDSIGKG